MGDLPERIGPYRVLRACPGGDGEDRSYVVWDREGRRHAVLQTYRPPVAGERPDRLVAQLEGDVALSRSRTPG